MSTFRALAAVTHGTTTGGDATITDLAYDSRAVVPGSLFFCVPGARADGHDFAAAAVAAGAVGLVVERELPLVAAQVVVHSARAAMAPIAAEFFGHPSAAMTLVGVTGTNGKTTTTFMLESVFRALRIVPGLIGTVETHIGDAVLPVRRTTPEAIDLQRLLARMRDAGVGGAAMEVSSHGLALGRADELRLACAIFTNLSPDHLDMHGTMDDYFEAKAALFHSRFTDVAVINTGDAWGRRLLERLDLGTVVTFAREGGADVRAHSVEMHAGGSSVVVDARGELVELRVTVAGRYNVENALGVIATAVALGWPLADVARGIEAMRGVPGRLEPIVAGQDFTVLVDYAHTPDALEGVLRAAREITSARVWVVFGCGGDRDRTKRAPMGRIAAELADHVIITSDNPRSEEPEGIVAEIEAGARETGRPFTSIVDRREALAAALRGAAAGDVVVIAGKGHESGQEFADRVVPFDDRTVAREILSDGTG